MACAFGGSNPSLPTSHKPKCERNKECGNSSVGRAQPCQGWGREFEPRFPLKKNKTNIGAVVQLVRILACHARGRGFEPRPHRQNKTKEREPDGVLFFMKGTVKRVSSPDPLHFQQRAISAAGSEHLPYKQRVGGSNPSSPTKQEDGSLAQLNRAFDYGSKGCRFESCRSHTKKSGHSAQNVRSSAIFAHLLHSHGSADISGW